MRARTLVALHTLHTCMRATRIAMVSYFQVTLWRGFVRVMSLIDASVASMREGAKAKNLHPSSKTFSLSSSSRYFEIRMRKNSCFSKTRVFHNREIRLSRKTNRACKRYFQQLYIIATNVATILISVLHRGSERYK